MLFQIEGGWVGLYSFATRLPRSHFITSLRDYLGPILSHTYFHTKVIEARSEIYQSIDFHPFGAKITSLIASMSGLRFNDARGLGVFGWWPDLPPGHPHQTPTAPQTNPMRRPTLSGSLPTTNLTTSSQVSGSQPTTNLTIPYYANQQGVSTDHLLLYLFLFFFSFLCRRRKLSGSLPTPNFTKFLNP